MQLTFSLKTFFKKTIPYIWGYGYLCDLIRYLFSNFLPFKWYMRLPIKPGQLINANLSFGTVILSSPERCSIAKKLYWTEGVVSPEEDRIAIEYFVKLTKISDFVLDIGSNSGIFSLASGLANKNIKVYAYDILPEAFHILVDNIFINNLSAQITPNLIGIGKKSLYKAPFEKITSEMPTSIKLDEDFKNVVSVNVEIKTLDEIFLENNITGQACIKIDVEGFEGDIFKNALDVLKNNRPFFLCEVLNRNLEVNDYDNILSSNNYKKFLITDSGLIEYKNINAHEKFKDWFFIPNEKLHEVKSFLKVG